MRPMPVVAIVGRPNVGKSSLLNALTQKRIAIVQDMPGVTRDRIAAPLKVADRFVELVDTGGYGFVDADQLTDHIHHQIELAMARATSKRSWWPTRPTTPRRTWRWEILRGWGWGRPSACPR
jgi:GTP-binding protein